MVGPRVEHQVRGPVPLLPEVEEAKERLGLFALAQVGVGIEGARVVVMGEKDTPLATAALRGWPLPVLDGSQRISNLSRCQLTDGLDLARAAPPKFMRIQTARRGGPAPRHSSQGSSQERKPPKAVPRTEATMHIRLSTRSIVLTLCLVLTAGPETLAAGKRPKNQRNHIEVANLNILHGLACGPPVPGDGDQRRVRDRLDLLVQHIAAAGCPDLMTLQENVTA